MMSVTCDIRHYKQEYAILVINIVSQYGAIDKLIMYIMERYINIMDKIVSK